MSVTTFFQRLRGADTDAGVAQFQSTPGAVLLDVRTAQEYRDGHIPGSRNLPLQAITQAGDFLPNLDTPVFVYCHSGARSRQATAFLRQMGYTNVKNIGGIAAYHGKVVK